MTYAVRFTRSAQRALAVEPTEALDAVRNHRTDRRFVADVDQFLAQVRAGIPG